MSGNLLILNFTSFDSDLTLVCIYGPNKDNPQFYQTIYDKICIKECACILCGDFLLVLNPDVDCLNYVNINNTKARGTVQNLILELDRFDCWREDHLEDRTYTWLKKTPLKQAR